MPKSCIRLPGLRFAEATSDFNEEEGIWSATSCFSSSRLIGRPRRAGTSMESLETFVPEPFLETMALGLRSQGPNAVRAAYEMQFFSAFPDLAPDDEGMAFGEGHRRRMGHTPRNQPRRLARSPCRRRQLRRPLCERWCPSTMG
jgi:hypothetical protein